MLTTSARQILPRFIVCDNIMPKINEKKMTSKFFGQLTCWNPWVFIFLTFSGAPKPRKKLSDDKKIGDKNVGDALYTIKKRKRLQIAARLDELDNFSAPNIRKKN